MIINTSALRYFVSAPSTRHRQQLVIAKALRPRLHGLVIDDAAGVYVSQRFLRQSVAFFFLGDPGGKRLAHDPAARAFKPLSHLIYLVGQRKRHVRGQYFGCCGHVAPPIGT